jgi:hypothetical protein
MESICLHSAGRLKYDVKNGVGGRNALSMPYCDSLDDDEVVAVGVDSCEAGDVDMRLLVVIKCKVTYLLDKHANVYFLQHVVPFSLTCMGLDNYHAYFWSICAANITSQNRLTYSHPRQLL